MAKADGSQPELAQQHTGRWCGQNQSQAAQASLSAGCCAASKLQPAARHAHKLVLLRGGLLLYSTNKRALNLVMQRGGLLLYSTNKRALNLVMQRGGLLLYSTKKHVLNSLDLDQSCQQLSLPVQQNDHVVVEPCGHRTVLRFP
jgi:hypothetical protein